MTPISVMPPDEILTALNELLEAERAGVRVALANARSEAASPYLDLMLAIKADEARWCAMLSGQIKRLGGTPSSKTDGFHAKALAIPGALDRLAFLNRELRVSRAKTCDTNTSHTRRSPVCGFARDAGLPSYEHRPRLRSSRSEQGFGTRLIP